MKKNKEKKSEEKDREEYGYGYDRSVDDLGVVGQIAANKDNNKLSSK